MATSKNTISFIVVGLAIVVILGYAAYVSVDVQTFPDIELAARGGLDEPVMSSTEYMTSGKSLVPVTNTRHRYPNVTGGNFTALIHRGMSPLRMRAPSDSKWIECPPGEVMF